MMTLGVRAHDFGRHSVTELPKIIKAAGFDSVQLAPAKAIIGVDSIADITPQLMDDIANSFAKNNLAIHILGCYIEPSLPDIANRLANVEAFKQNLTYAKQAGITYVGTETTHLNPYTTTDEQRLIAYNRLLDSTQRMIEHAEAVGVQVALEPVAEHTLNTPQLAHQLVSTLKSDKLSMIFDPVNLILPTTYQHQNQIYTDFFDLLGDRLCVLHAKDTTFSGNTTQDEKIWANIGQGVVNYDHIMAYLQDKHPNLTILREVAHRDSYSQDLAKLQQLAGLN